VQVVRIFIKKVRPSRLISACSDAFPICSSATDTGHLKVESSLRRSGVRTQKIKEKPLNIEMIGEAYPHSATSQRTNKQICA